jgi:hypothetical protein
VLQKLKIIAFSNEKLTTRAGTYEVRINPEKYTHAHQTAFSEDVGVDTASIVPKFKTQKPQDISFDFYIDATGVVPGIIDVTAEIKRFKAVAYDYNGQAHSANYLILSWGTLVFHCMLTSLSVEYTLFSPAGIPLRAKIGAKFRQHMTPEQVAKRADKKSADLTHARTVVDAMTLPLMCNDIYRDSRHYIAVARANDRNDIMHLRPGETILFPPLGD